jgi:putative component of membrane protein insertase Oxa1/YidC/SpoIIIJ protein YidD
MRISVLFVLLLIPTLFLAEVGYIEPWGADSGIKADKSPIEKTASCISPLARVAKGLITFYQSHLSKTTGPRSHFKPSSSHYTLEAILTHGFLKGWLMGCDRLMRENAEPWVYPKRWIDEKWYNWDPPPNSCREQEWIDGSLEPPFIKIGTKSD